MRGIAAVLLLTLASACAPEPQPARPALWEVRGQGDQVAWLFGTIHSLPGPVAWRTPLIAGAMKRADRIVVEVENLGDDAAVAETFSRLASSPGQTPLPLRLAPDQRGKLAALLAKAGMKAGQFDGTETWAAALTLARVGAPEGGGRHGIDRAVIESAGAKPVIGLEGAEGQLRIFDALPEKEQRDLLTLVVSERDDPDERNRLAETWRKGDMKAIEAETRNGLLADPELRQALFTARNQAWLAKLEAMLKQGQRPFVAVGAAHMAGPEGLPALLTARGYAVKRVQ